MEKRTLKRKKKKSENVNQKVNIEEKSSNLNKIEKSRNSTEVRIMNSCDTTTGCNNIVWSLLSSGRLNLLQVKSLAAAAAGKTQSRAGSTLFNAVDMKIFLFKAAGPAAGYCHEARLRLAESNLLRGSPWDHVGQGAGQETSFEGLSSPKFTCRV